MSRLMNDAFISHATEDKETLVRAVAHGLRDRGLNIWYDEFSLRAGDSLRAKIDEGLSSCRFGIVVLSKAFFEKRWPQNELNGLFSVEIAGNATIIPVWFGVTYEDVTSYSPILADRIAIVAQDKPDDVADQIYERIVRDVADPSQRYPNIHENEEVHIHGYLVPDYEHRISKVEHRFFRNCRICGPAVLVCSNTTFSNIRYDPEWYFAMQPNRQYHGFVQINDCYFETCTFEEIGFAMREEQLPPETPR